MFIRSARSSLQISKIDLEVGRPIIIGRAISQVFTNLKTSQDGSCPSTTTNKLETYAYFINASHKNSTVFTLGYVASYIVYMNGPVSQCLFFCFIVKKVAEMLI